VQELLSLLAAFAYCRDNSYNCKSTIIYMPLTVDYVTNLFENLSNGKRERSSLIMLLRIYLGL
jgi:hypothetical protein